MESRTGSLGGWAVKVLVGSGVSGAGTLVVAGEGGDVTGPPVVGGATVEDEVTTASPARSDRGSVSAS